MLIYFDRSCEITKVVSQNRLPILCYAFDQKPTKHFFIVFAIQQAVFIFFNNKNNNKDLDFGHPESEM